MSNKQRTDWDKQLAPVVDDWVDAVFGGGLSDNAKKVAMVLAYHFDDALIASLTMFELTWDADITVVVGKSQRHSEAGTRAALNELVSHAYIERRSHPGYANEYAAVLSREFMPEEFYAWLEANSTA